MLYNNIQVILLALSYRELNLKGHIFETFVKKGIYKL